MDSEVPNNNKRGSAQLCDEIISKLDDETRAAAEQAKLDADSDNDTGPSFGLVLADQNQKITHVSSGFTKLTGYDWEDSIGKNCGFLQGKATNPSAVDTIRECLMADRECRVSILNYRKDGTPFWNSLTISPVMDATGRVTNYIGIQMSSHKVDFNRSLGSFKWTTSVRGSPLRLSPASSPQTSPPRSPKATIEDVEGDESEEEEGKTEFELRPFSRREHVSFVSETNLPTRKGVYLVKAYKDYTKDSKESEIIVLCHGEVEGLEDVPCRVHDQCFTSEVIGSLKCDCKEQLDFAMDYIKDRKNGPGGVVVYMPQEGRGIGLANKIKAYNMQEKGLDTVDANRILGFHDDYREYGAVAAILDHMNVKSIRLMTNNPRKVKHLTSCGVEISDRIPVICELNEHSEKYVGTKGSRMGHFVKNL